MVIRVLEPWIVLFCLGPAFAGGGGGSGDSDRSSAVAVGRGIVVCSGSGCVGVRGGGGDSGSWGIACSALGASHDLVLEVWWPRTGFA